MSGFESQRRVATPIGCGAVALLVLLTAAPALAASALDRTQSGHLAPPPPDGQLPIAPPIVQYALPPQWMTIRSKEDWRKAGKFEKELSKDCAALRFNEISPLRFRAYFKGEVMGVAFGHGLNLRDPGKKADPKKIYLFRNGDSTGCTVQSLDNQDPRVNPAAGQATTPAGSGFKKY